MTLILETPWDLWTETNFPLYLEVKVAICNTVKKDVCYVICAMTQNVPPTTMP